MSEIKSFNEYKEEVTDEILSEEFSNWFDDEYGIVTERVLVAPQEISQPWGKADPESEYLGVFYEKVLEYVNKVKDKFTHGLKAAARKTKQPKILVDVKSLKSFIDKTVMRGKAVDKIKVIEHEIKERDESGDYGYYGSHHFLVDLDGVIAEIQVMTKKLWAYKEAAHQIYNKYRSAQDADKDLEKMDKAISRKLFDLGNRGRSIPNKKKRT